MIVLTQTHWLIGGTIGKIITRRFPNRLDENLFKYGCTLPDFSLRYITIPHCKNESFELVTGLIKQTDFTSLTKTEKNENSLRLGIITHFVSDYFCQAHNYSEYDRFIKHFKYEAQLHQEFNKVSLPRLCRNYHHAGQLSGFRSAGDLPGFIHKSHWEYLQEKRHQKTDVAFCLDVVTTVAMAIVSCYPADRLQQCA